MVGLEAIQRYTGPALERGATYLYLAPHPRLRATIANYTLTCPMAEGMSGAYTILPTVSTTITVAVGAHGIASGLRGVNTVAETVGGYARQQDVMLLVECHPGGLTSLLREDQRALLNTSFALADLDRGLTRALEGLLVRAVEVRQLVAALDALFLARLEAHALSGLVRDAVTHIVAAHGEVTVQALAARYFYSEKQLRRIFLEHVGTGPKAFARVARVHHALRCLQNAQTGTEAAQAAGYFDQAHFIHDFRSVFGLSPSAYLQNMSIYYNDTYKL